MHSTETKELSYPKLESSNIPQRFWDLDVTTYAGDPNALLSVSIYTKHLQTMRKDGMGLFFRGGHESYKTFLACYVAMFAMCHDYVAHYFAMSELVEGILQNEIKMQAYRTPDFLVLDNLSFESHQFWPTALHRVLTVRKDAGKPTIFCTRLDDERLEASYGEENLLLLKNSTQEIRTHVEPALLERRRNKSRLPFIQSAE